MVCETEKKWECYTTMTCLWEATKNFLPIMASRVDLLLWRDWWLFYRLSFPLDNHTETLELYLSSTSSRHLDLRRTVCGLLQSGSLAGNMTPSKRLSKENFVLQRCGEIKGASKEVHRKCYQPLGLKQKRREWSSELSETCSYRRSPRRRSP